MLDSATRYSRKNRSPRILIAVTRTTRDSTERYGILWKTSRGSITTGICFLIANGIPTFIYSIKENEFPIDIRDLMETIVLAMPS